MPKLNNFFRAMPDHCMYFDLDLNIIEITDAYLAMIQLPRQQVIGRHIYDVFPSRPGHILERKRLDDSFRHVLEKKEQHEMVPVRYDLELQGKLVQKYWKITHTPVFNEAGRFVAIFHRTLDVTNEDRLRKEETSADILNKISEGFITINEDLIITNANETALGYTKRPLEEVVGKHLDTYSTNVEDRSRFRARTLNVFETNVPVHFIDRYGDSFLQTSVYPTSNGEVAIFFRDITQEKLDEDRLKEALKLRDEFLSIASHELKTPLTSLRLQTEIGKDLVANLKADPETARRLDWTFDVTGRGIERLSRLVDSMLDISRMSVGKLRLDLEVFCLNNLVKELMEHHLVRDRFPEFTFEVREEKEVIGCWDPFRIEQVIVNLLSNAVRYAGKGAVTITVSGDETQAIVSVKDQGPGVPKEHQERIFQQFERLEGTNSTGLGLGLYICREIVQRHGGELRLESAPGEGANFSMVLPLNLA